MKHQIHFHLICIFSLICMLLPAAVHSQINSFPLSKNGISLGFSTFLTPPQEIVPFYETRKDASFESKPRFSFQGRMEYNRLLHPRFEVSLGIMVGVYPFDFVISMDSSFSKTNRAFSHYSIDRGGAIYGGTTLKLGYIHPLKTNQFISVHLGVNYVFFITQWYNFSLSWVTGTDIVKMSEAKAKVNPSEKAFLAPELSFKYQLKLGKYFTPYISVFGVYSNNRPIVGNSYSIFGKNETLQGTFSRRFLHAGLEAGCRFSII